MTAVTRDKNFDWRRVDTRSLGLEGMKVAIVGGTGGIGRALSRILVSRGAAVLQWPAASRRWARSGQRRMADRAARRRRRRIRKPIPGESRPAAALRGRCDAQCAGS